MRHNIYQLKINQKKVVPKICIVGDAKIENKKFYQYTAIDEYSRY